MRGAGGRGRARPRASADAFALARRRRRAAPAAAADDGHRLARHRRRTRGRAGGRWPPSTGVPCRRRRVRRRRGAAAPAEQGAGQAGARRRAAAPARGVAGACWPPFAANRSTAVHVADAAGAGAGRLVRASSAADAAEARPLASSATAPAESTERGLRFGLQIPQFTWPGGPAEIGPRLRDRRPPAEAAGFDDLWVMDHFRQIPMMGPPWHDMLESWTTLAHLAACTDDDPPRHAGHRHHLSQRRPPRQDRGDARRAVGRAGDVRPRARLVRGRAPRLRLAVPEPGRAVRAARGRARAAAAPVGPGQQAVRRPRAARARHVVLPAPAAGPRADPRRRIGRAAHACGSSPSTPTPATCSASRTIVRRKVAVLARHCADVGRDPGDGVGVAPVDRAGRSRTPAHVRAAGRRAPARQA